MNFLSCTKISKVSEKALEPLYLIHSSHQLSPLLLSRKQFLIASLEPRLQNKSPHLESGTIELASDFPPDESWGEAAKKATPLYTFRWNERASSDSNQVSRLDLSNNWAIIESSTFSTKTVHILTTFASQYFLPMLKICTDVTAFAFLKFFWQVSSWKSIMNGCLRKVYAFNLFLIKKWEIPAGA